MDTLLENPLPILSVGAILATFFGLIFMARRNVPSLVGLGAAILFTSLLLITEQLIVTPREEVETALEEVLQAIRSNDHSSVINLLDPNGGAIRWDADVLMSEIEVENTGATAIEIEVDTDSSPNKATSHFRGSLRGIHRRTGVPVPYSDQVELRWLKRDERWLLYDYTAYNKGKPLDPVINHLRAKYPRSKPSLRSSPKS